MSQVKITGIDLAKTNFYLFSRLCRINDGESAKVALSNI